MSDIVPWVAAGDLNCTPCDIDPAVLAKAATIIAENLCGHEFGLRGIRLRPSTLSPNCHVNTDAFGYGAGYGYFGFWGWFGLFVSFCGCPRVRQIHLDQPVNSITAVKVDGVDIGSNWRLYGDNRLVRTDGGTFPCCQDEFRDPDADFGTLEVACVIGAAPDEAGEMAVQEIACEMGKAIEKPEACRLPRRVASVTRQQLSVSFPNPSNAYSKGFVDLPLVDLWLASLDADQRRRGGRVVDLSRQTTWRAPAV